ncbi:MAG: hypothetical protein J6Y86_11375 [Pseudobutyrivibrio sp.]|nr:hypothetical protein [Pseudobutyrivibrio sp.]
MMDASQWFLLAIGLTALAGLVIVPAREAFEDKRYGLKKLAIFLLVLGLACIIRLYIFIADQPVKNPSTGFGDTEVDRMLDYIKSDGIDIYTEDEILGIVYKYLKKYTREGKYENRTVYIPNGGR